VFSSAAQSPGTAAATLELQPCLYDSDNRTSAAIEYF
jgi:hypothetical protein